MLCSNQQALGQAWPFLRDEPPVLVDWLPWSHTFGGNHNLGQVLAFGGALYIDDGKPAPGLFDRTVDALRQVRPTVYYNVPPATRCSLRASRPTVTSPPLLLAAALHVLRLGGAPRTLWNRLRALADAVADHAVPLTASWGDDGDRAGGDVRALRVRCSAAASACRCPASHSS